MTVLRTSAFVKFYSVKLIKDKPGPTPFTYLQRSSSYVILLTELAHCIGGPT